MPILKQAEETTSPEVPHARHAGGRPPLGDAARKQTQIRLSPEERERLNAAARAEGQEFGPWLRGLGLARARKLGV